MAHGPTFTIAPDPVLVGSPFTIADAGLVPGRGVDIRDGVDGDGAWRLRERACTDR